MCMSMIKQTSRLKTPHPSIYQLDQLSIIHSGRKILDKDIGEVLLLLHVALQLGLVRIDMHDLAFKVVAVEALNGYV